MPRQASDDAQWLAAIDDFRSSGLTQPEFYRRRGLPLHTFRRPRNGPAIPTSWPRPASPGAGVDGRLAEWVRPAHHRGRLPGRGGRGAAVRTPDVDRFLRVSAELGDELLGPPGALPD
jgi:hypothetical protein